MDEEARWLYFFREGKNIDINAPPEVLLTKQMEEKDHQLEENAKQLEEKDAIIEELKRKLEGKD